MQYIIIIIIISKIAGIVGKRNLSRMHPAASQPDRSPNSGHQFPTIPLPLGEHFDESGTTSRFRWQPAPQTVALFHPGRLLCFILVFNVIVVILRRLRPPEHEPTLSPPPTLGRHFDGPERTLLSGGFQGFDGLCRSFQSALVGHSRPTDRHQEQKYEHGQQFTTTTAIGFGGDGAGQPTGQDVGIGRQILRPFVERTSP